MATVGTGKYTYELVEDWVKLPKGWTLGQTGIVTDARDRVYLFNRGEHPLICLLYTSPSPRDLSTSRMPSSA